MKESGFELPEGYTWDTILENGKKEGMVTVKDEKGRVFRKLQFKNDQLNGVCRFYRNGKLVEKREYVNDKEEGWSCEINRGKERWFMCSDGVRIAEIQKCEENEDYWRAIDSDEKTLSICRYDDNHKPTGKGYIYVNNSIDRAVLFKNGVEGITLKRFDGDKMVEYDNNGYKVYEGSFANSIAKDYARDGDGIEYDGGEIVYEGGFVNGKREGEGCSFKDGYVDYEG